MSCGVGDRQGLDPVLLWLWLRPAAVDLIRPLAWELPYATSAALKRKKKNCSHGSNLSYRMFMGSRFHLPPHIFLFLSIPFSFSPANLKGDSFFSVLLLGIDDSF